MSVEHKLDILSQMINFVRYSKMSVVFNGERPLLKCDKVVGTTNYCLALKLHRDYYVPVSCLNDDVRNFGDEIYRVIAIFSTDLDSTIYSTIQNVAKGIILTDIIIPQKYSNIIDLSSYNPK